MTLEYGTYKNFHSAPPSSARKELTVSEMARKWAEMFQTGRRRPCLLYQRICAERDGHFLKPDFFLFGVQRIGHSRLLKNRFFHQCLFPEENLLADFSFKSLQV